MDCRAEDTTTSVIKPMWCCCSHQQHTGAWFSLQRSQGGRLSPLVSQWLIFVPITVLLAVTPGADTILVMRLTITDGRATALRAILGIVSGLLVWATLAVLGIGAVIAASATAFNIIRYAGAVYLVYLGVLAIRSSHFIAPVRTGTDPAPPLSTAQAYRRGLLTNLLNPKVGVLFTSFLPQFVVVGSSVLVQTTALALFFIATGVGWQVLLTSLIVRFQHALERPRVRRRLDWLTGIVLILIALRLLLERR